MKDKISAENTLFCFEDTGVYSMPLACVLSEQSLDYRQVAVLEIKHSKSICRGKSDKIDSRDIAFYALSHLHKLRLSKVSGTVIQQLKLLFTEREKMIRASGSFERTPENKDFLPKEVFKPVENINKTVVNQLKTALKKTKEKIMEIIAENERIAKQMEPVTSIKGIGKFTAMYLIVCTNGFEKFEYWRQMACYAGVAPFEHTSGTSVRGKTKVPYCHSRLRGNNSAVIILHYKFKLIPNRNVRAEGYAP